mmetsp:Transcript_116852/g.330610  ORF Transcript_116852/g.330610 Transcript_116852/m.330610 type:complete len:201 (+) Transcript_116852:594-1196(+)
MDPRCDVLVAELGVKHEFARRSSRTARAAASRSTIGVGTGTAVLSRVGRVARVLGITNSFAGASFEEHRKRRKLEAVTLGDVDACSDVRARDVDDPRMPPWCRTARRIWEEVLRPQRVEPRPCFCQETGCLRERLRTFVFGDADDGRPQRRRGPKELLRSGRNHFSPGRDGQGNVDGDALVQAFDVVPNAGWVIEHSPRA